MATGSVQTIFDGMLVPDLPDALMVEELTEHLNLAQTGSIAGVVIVTLLHDGGYRTWFKTGDGLAERMLGLIRRLEHVILRSLARAEGDE